MENPAAWGKAERVVDKAMREWLKSQEAGIIGRSKVKAITDALREADLLKE